jgi:hypothetical protein
MDGGDMPTRDEWLEEQERKRGAVQERVRQPREAHILQGKNKA